MAGHLHLSNLAALTALTLLAGGCSMRNGFLKELKHSDVAPDAPADARVITESDLAALPEPAQRYMRFMGVVGKPRDWSFRVCFLGKFRQKPTDRFMDAEMWQYNRRNPVARMFQIKVHMFGLPVIARDYYEDGQGSQRVKMAELITVARGANEEQSIGGLVTWVNDALVMAPSLLLGPESTFAAVPGDPDAFDLTFTDRGHTVKSRVFVDASGAMVDFSTTDRFYEDWVTKETRRGEWRTPISSYKQIDGHKVAGVGQATWHTTDRGEFTYVTIDRIPEDSARWNVAPGQ